MATDSKSALVQFLQRSIGRTLKKEDVVYTTHNSGEYFQSTVKLVCKEGEEYAGELCTNEKEASQSAAAQALKDFAAEIAALPMKPPKNKAKAEDPNAGLMAMMGLGAPAGVAQVPNSKTELVQKLQVHCKRAMTKADVTYEVAKIINGFQATVKLVCTGGQEFTGEVCTGEKLAQHAAAQQALLNAHMWLGAAVVQPPQPAKRKMPDQTSSNPKSELVMFLQRRLKRALNKSDIVYAASQTVGGGFQATVELACFQNRQFAGEVCESGKSAEAAAAYQALLSLTSEFGEPAPAKKMKTAAGGQAFGGQQMQPGVKAQMQLWNGGRAAAAGWAATPAAGGKGQVKAGGGANEPRTLVSQDAITGEVIEWNEGGGFGWLRPFAVVDHPEAHKRGGKIFVHKKDLNDANPVGTGTMVQFRVYSDSRGLGACEVQPF